MPENDIGTDGSDETLSSTFMVLDDDDDDDNNRGRQRFARSLDSKLKKLQRNHHNNNNHNHNHKYNPNHNHNHNNKRTSASSRKPIFVTTVKTGIFLDPPPDLAALLGLDDRSSSTNYNRYYSYSSEPRVFYDRQHQRTVTRKIDHRPDMCKQMGYTNIMHDKRVVRGSNFAKKSFRPKWNPYFGYAKQLSSELGKESPAAREAEARRRTMARKKAMDYQTRALRLHLGAPKLTKGRQDVDIQTDRYLEELYDYPQSQTFGAQTEFDQELFSNLGTGMSTGTDVSTQVDEKDLFDFDTEVTPVAENLIADVFRQAMREVLYEDELETRARQQRTLYLQHTIEEIGKQKLEHEDKRLDKVMADHAQMFDRISDLTSGSVTELLPEVLNDLNQNGFNTTENSIESPEFVSWIIENLQDKTKRIDSNEILKNMIYELVKSRLDSFNKITDVQNIQKPTALFEEIESISQQPTQNNETDQTTDS